MWRLIKFVVWTTLSIWFGIFLATYQVAGHTPWQHMQRAWEKNAMGPKIDSKVNNLKETLHGVWDDAKDHVTGDASRKPKERHSAEERDAVNKLIANRNGT